MSPLVPTSVTLIAALGLALYVLLSRPKARYHWLLFGVLLGVAIWTAGAALRLSVETVEGLRAAQQLIYLGVLATPLAWLVLAGFVAQARFIRSPAALSMLCTPPALLYLCLVTNEGHRLFIRDVSFSAMEAGPLAFAGPVFWLAVVWAYGCTATGIWFYAKAVARTKPMHGALVILAASVPSLVYLLQIVPIGFDLTPAGFLVTLTILYVGTFRHQLLASLPLAHHAVVDELEDGVVMASPIGTIVGCNPAAERLLGREAASLRGCRLDEVLAPLRAPVEHPGERDADSGWIEITEGEVHHGDRHAGHFALLLDRAEEKRSEQLVQRAQRLETVGALAAGIAHEINDPLAFACSNLAELVRMGQQVEESRGGEGPDAALAGELHDLQAIAEETLDGVERMARIVADMRRLTTEPQRCWEPVDLTEVVRDAIRLSRVEAAASGLETHFDESVWVDGSAERLVQVVVNLLANARQAVDAGGRVRVEVSARDDTALVVVADEGPGIPDALRERIFDPFFTTKGPDAGSGLGLAIAYDIARDHGGVLEECGEPGAGARFELRLPRLSQSAGDT